MQDPAQDTIAAIATGPARGAVGMIRLSGPRAREIVSRLLIRSSESRVAPELPAHRMRQAWVADPRGGELVDQVLVCRMPAPRSYTGEDVVELFCHGSPAVLESVLGLCLDQGARPAEAGEFTRRAFENGKLDLAQAEAVLALASASTGGAVRNAARQLEGGLSREVRRLRESLIGTRVQLEAALDFPDEEIEPRTRRELHAGLNGVRERVASLAASWRRGRAVLGQAVVAVVGRRNAGKSTLVNRLVGTDRVIVSPEPGTTRDAVEIGWAADGLSLALWDTAGLGQSSGEVESQGMAKSRELLRRAELVLWVVDRSVALSEEDEQVRALIDAVGTTRVIVATKSDLPGAWATEQVGPDVVVSGLTGEGVETLRQRIVEHFGEAGGEGIVVIRERHARALGELAGLLDTAIEELEQGQTELTAENLRLGTDLLGNVTGEVVSERILLEVFQEFCIGK